MPPMDTDVGRATAALERGDWEAARTEFERELSAGETAESHDGLARALWWSGLPDRAIEHRERAFVLWKDRGDESQAGMAAVWLAREHLAIYGNDAVANGWLARAERLIGDTAVPARGHLELARGRRSGDAAERERRATVALEIASRAGHPDPDLEVAALAELGLAGIEQGRIAEGLDRLDEAMAAATGGEADLLETVAGACCSLVAACDLAGDAGRLEQWARIVAAFVERRGDLPLLAFCRTCNAQMLAATGEREAAERELMASAASLRESGHRSRCVDPAVKLAEVRLLQGRIEEAASLLDGREDLPEATIPAADRDMARGETTLAAARLLRRINLLGRDSIMAPPLMERLLEAQIAAGDLDGARGTVDDLTAIAGSGGHPLFRAHADLGAARLEVATGGDPQAHYEAAADRLTKLGQNLDGARARLELASAVAGSQPELAGELARSAERSFAALGAARLEDEAAALSRRVGGPARTGPKDLGLLTRREQEVLWLLAEGLTNAEIAARLFISSKTAGHHVSNILAKLHLRSRQEAAAFAVRHLEGTRDPI